IAHEMAHMWFGDYVTCENWQDIWVNEGFASYSEYLADQYLVSQTEADNWMVTAHNYAFDEPQGSIYVPAAYEMDEQRIFSYELSYKKGASIIHTIRFLLDNDTTFFNILKDFQIQFGDSVATGDDFNNTLASVSGMNFDDFFDQWYYGEGFPTYNVTWTQRNDSLIMDVLQTTSSSYTPFFGNDMEYMIQAVTGDSVIRVQMNQNQQNYSIYFPDSIYGIIVDPANWVLNKDTVVFIYTDPNGAEEMPLLSEAINIYPNPVEEMLNIDVRLQKNNCYDIQIVDMAGRVMLNVSEFKNRTAVNVSGLESGMYLLKVSDGNVTASKLFVRE
ncbi:MAG: M1 family aminopeptidase, partial [Bacteroidota bacterium]